MTDRELMQQALEALEKLGLCCDDCVDDDALGAASDVTLALRERLNYETKPKEIK